MSILVWGRLGFINIYLNAASYPDVSLSLSLSMNICAQRKAGGRKRAFLLPIVPCASSPVTRLSIRFSLASVRKTKLLHEEKAVSK